MVDSVDDLNVFVICEWNSNAELWSTRCGDYFSTEQKHHQFSLQKKKKFGGTKGPQEGPFPSRKTDRLLDLWVLRVPGANDSVEYYADLLTFVLRNDDIQEFDSKWDGILLSMTKIPRDEILQGLHKLRIRGSEKLKTVLELYDLEIHQKQTGPDSHRFKTMVKRSIEPDSRNWNFGARNGNYDRNAEVKNPGTKQLVQQILGVVGNVSSTGSVLEEISAVCVTISINVRKWHSRIRPLILACSRMIEMRRELQVPEESPSGRMSRWPYKDYSKGIWTNSILWKGVSSRMLVLQDQEWLQIWRKVLVCTSSGWWTTKWKGPRRMMT